MNSLNQGEAQTPPTPSGGVKRDTSLYFAAERTLLAWIRTGLALMGFGFVVARFGLFLRELTGMRAGGPAPKSSTGLSLGVGTALVAIGVAVNVAAAVQHARFARSWRSGQPIDPGRHSLGIFLAILLAFIGGVMGIYLIIMGRSS